MGARERGSTEERTSRRIRLAVLVVAVLLASMIADRLLPSLGVALDRPTRLTFPPNLDVRRPQPEFTYTLRTNRWGLRAPDIPLQRPAGAKRVLLLGDAQTAGVGVEAGQTFAARIDRDLADATVINGGKPWANTLDQARIFAHVGLRYDPNAVVLCISGDDLADMPSRDIEDVLQPPAPPAPLLARLWPNVYGAWAASAQRARATRAREPTDWTARMERIARRKKIAEGEICRWRTKVAEFPKLVAAAGRDAFNGNVMAFGLFWPQNWAAALDIAPGHGEAAWKQMRLVLDVLAAEAAWRKIQLTIVFLPARVQYRREYQDLLRGFGHHMTDRWLTTTSRFQVALGRWCGDREIPFLDLTTAFRTHPRPATLSTPYSGLLTAKGHARVAERLGPWLRENTR